MNLLVLSLSTVANHLWRKKSKRSPGRHVTQGEAFLIAKRTVPSCTKKCVTGPRKGSKRSARILSFRTHSRRFFSRAYLKTRNGIYCRLRAPTARTKKKHFSAVFSESFCGEFTENRETSRRPDWKCRNYLT